MAKPAEEKSIKEVVARSRGVHISPQKMRLVAVLVRKLSVAKALEQLGATNKKAALPLRKLIESAIANAKYNFQIEEERLFIKTLTIDEGRVFKRHTPRAQGRASPIRKRTSRITLVLGVSAVSSKKAKPSQPFRPAVSESRPMAKPDEKPVPKDIAEKPAKRKFWFWKRKTEDVNRSQVMPKQDLKGKKYTSFDRRGNM